MKLKEKEAVEMLLTKREVIAIQNLLTKWANEAGIPISWKKIYLQYASEQLIADDEQVDRKSVV